MQELDLLEQKQNPIFSYKELCQTPQEHTKSTHKTTIKTLRSNN